jgi:hypothetical protein
MSDNRSSSSIQHRKPLRAFAAAAPRSLLAPRTDK